MSCLYCQTVTTNGVSFCCRACEILHAGQFHLLQKKALENKNQKWMAYDSETAQDLYATVKTQDTLTYRFYVQGLQCASCIHLLEKLPEFETHVKNAQVYFGCSELIVEIDKDFPLSQLLILIEEMGYQPHPLKKEESAQIQQNLDKKRWLKEIAVAGACTGNIMMFVVPIYSGVDEPYRSVFLWLSFLLFLPILFYSAGSIYKGAWRALKTQHLNTDLSLSIALIGGFLFSSFNLLRGSGEVYFDSTASFIFLILISRYFVKKNQEKTILRLQEQDHFYETSYLKRKEEGWQAVLPSTIQKGDEIKLTQNQILPVDAEILQNQSSWDTSLMTGEVLPRVYQRGMKVLAGFRLLDGDARLQSLGDSEQSEMHKMMQLVSSESLHKSSFVQKMDLWSQRLLLTVFVTGLVFFVGYSFIDLEQAFQRTLALWVVACPCALAFAAPLTLYKALLEARKKGFLIKNADVLEKATNVKELFFDKTGTLTTGQLQLVKTAPEFISPYLQDIILELEKNSHHPIAFAFRKAWSQREHRDIELSDVHEIIGEKVYGLHDGKIYSLQSAKQQNENLVIQLFENAKIMATFEFRDELYQNTEEKIKSLAHYYTPYILSGDKQERVLSLAHQLSIPDAQALFAQTPLQKWNILKNHPQALMMGDGANDAAALKQAYIGVASFGSLEMSFKAADIYLMKRGLEPLLQFFKISKKYQQILKRNFMLAITYNTVAGVCALLGFINPLTAALLMPLSSILLLFSTLEGWS